MGGLAALAREAGHRVTGCDAQVYPPMSDQLRALGIELIEGYGADQLALEPDVFVVGNVVTRGNPLMEAVLDAGARYTSGPQWLAEHVLQGRHVLAVAGTHGKTTTTAMLAWILEQAGLQPGFLVGGVPLNFGVSARLGQPAGPSSSRPTNTTPRSSTSAASSCTTGRAPPCSTTWSTTTPTSFPTWPPSRRQFHHLVRTVPASGRLVVNARDAALQRVLARGCWSEVLRFGTKREEPGGLCARGEPQAFDVLRGSLKVGRVDWNLLGEHNQMNALAAIGAADHVGRGARGGGGGAGAASRTCAAGWSCAARPARRQGLRRLRAPPHRHAHHGGRPAPALEQRGGAGRAARAHPGRVRAALQHHEAGHHEGAAALGAGRGRPGFCLQGDYGWSVREALAPLGAEAVVADSVDALVAAIVQAARPGDHVLCMSNGGFGGIHGKLLDALKAARPGDDRRTCSTCTASARRRSPSRRSACRPGWPSTGPRCAGGARSCRRRRARRWRWCSKASPAGRRRARPCSAARSAASTPRRWPQATGWPAVLLNPAVDPARDLARLRRRADRRSTRPTSTSSSAPNTSTSCAQLAVPAITHPERYLRRHRQGRRGAGLARDERRATPARSCACSKAATTRCRTSTSTCPHLTPAAVLELAAEAGAGGAGRPRPGAGPERRQSGRCMHCSMTPANSTPAA